MLPSDLVEAFGEKHIVFGHTPPSLENISFKVQGMDYDTCIRYIFNVIPGEPPIQSHTDPPTYDPSFNYHHFYNHTECISEHKLKTVDSYHDVYIRENDSAFIIGDESTHRFTAYYEEQITEEGSGRPTNAILISGTLVYDTITGQFLGVEDYRIGKKILRYKERPSTPSYAEGTIEIKISSQKLCPFENWD